MNAGQSWTSEPFVIHVNGDPPPDLTAAKEAGALVRVLRLAGLRSADDLYQRTTEVFEISGPMGGWPGMVDWLAGPDWLPIEVGAVMVFDANDAVPTVLRHLVSMLPAIAESWRTGGLPLVIHLINVNDVPVAAGILAEENERLDAAARVSWSVNNSGAVSVQLG